MSVQFLVKAETQGDNSFGHDAVLLTLTDDSIQLIEKRAKMLLDMHQQDGDLWSLVFKNPQEADWQSMEYEALEGHHAYDEFENGLPVPCAELPASLCLGKSSVDSPHMKLYVWDGGAGLVVNVFWGAFPGEDSLKTETPSFEVGYLRKLFDEHSQCPY